MNPLRFSTRQLLWAMLLVAISVHCWVYICHPQRSPTNIQLVFVAYVVGCITAGGAIGTLVSDSNTGMQVGLLVAVVMVLVGSVIVRLI